MKKLYFILGLLYLSYSIQAQESGDVVIGVSTNFPFLMKDKEINVFQTDYEKAYKLILDHGFNSSSIPYNYKFIANYWMSDFMGICFDYSFTHYQQKLKFTTGESREFSYNLRNYFEGGLCLGNPQRFYTNLIFGVATSTFSSTYYYKDGEKDMNYTSPINGVYSASGFSYRLDLNYKIVKNIAIVLSYGGIVGSEYTDKSFMKGIDVHGASETVYFPNDFAEFNTQMSNNTSYNYPIDRIAKLKQSNFSIGIQYQFKLFNHKFNL